MRCIWPGSWPGCCAQTAPSEVQILTGQTPSVASTSNESISTAPTGMARHSARLRTMRVGRAHRNKRPCELHDAGQRGHRPAGHLREHPHGGPDRRGRRPAPGDVQRAELLPDHRRPIGRLHVLHRPRTATTITVNAGCDVRGAANADQPQAPAGQDRRRDQQPRRRCRLPEEIENSALFGLDRDDALTTLVYGAERRGRQRGLGVRAAPRRSPAPPRTSSARRSSTRRRRRSRSARRRSSTTQALRQRSPADRPGLQAGRRGGLSAFIAIVNHFKSKGSGTGADADQGDGQGASNARASPQANALVAFANERKAARARTRCS